MPKFSSNINFQKVAQAVGMLLHKFTTTLGAEADVDVEGQLAFDQERQKVVCFADGDLKALKYDDKVSLVGVDLVKNVRYEIQHNLNDNGILVEIWHEDEKVFIPVKRGKVLDGTDTENYINLESSVDATGVHVVLIH